MFRSKRDEYNSSSGSSGKKLVTYGDFYYGGVECRYSVYRDGSGYTISVSYDKSEVEWVDRDRFESNVSYALRRELSDFNISYINFYRA